MTTETNEVIKTVDEVIGAIIYWEHTPEDGEELEIGGRSVRCRVNEVGTIFEIDEDENEDYDEIQHVSILHAADPDCETDWHHYDNGEIDYSMDVEDAIGYMAKYLADDTEAIEEIKKNFVSTKKRIETIGEAIARLIQGDPANCSKTDPTNLTHTDPDFHSGPDLRLRRIEEVESWRCDDGPMWDIYDEDGKEVAYRILYHHHDGAGDDDWPYCYCGGEDDDVAHWYSVDDDYCWDEINLDDLSTTD
tara:strand:+ start:1198 stop:1941 length:744 start_codon:yes stop_codon:yes gene_type:complete